MSKDFVQEIVGLVQEIAELDDRKRAQVEMTIRHRFGGERVNIRPTPPVDLAVAVQTIDQKLRQGLPVRAIAQDTGVCRATIYRWIKKSRTARRQCAK